MIEQTAVSPFQGTLQERDYQTLDNYLHNLTRPVRIVVWASERNSCTEGNAIHLARFFSDRYPHINFQNKPRIPNFSLYPVIGIMGIDEQGSEIDFGIRFIGLPAWYHINTLVGAIQAVSFRASTLKALTRINLSHMPADDVNIQIFTDPEDEGGVLMGTLCANFAVFQENIRVWIGMLNDFPQLQKRYGNHGRPHTLINNRYHLQGTCTEEELVRHIAKALPNSA